MLTRWFDSMSTRINRSFRSTIGRRPTRRSQALSGMAHSIEACEVRSFPSATATSLVAGHLSIEATTHSSAADSPIMTSSANRGIINPLPPGNSTYALAPVQSVGLIETPSNTPGWVHVGSGTLIDSRFVLTAAHVVVSSENGGIARSATFDLNGVRYQVARIYVHPNYDQSPNPSGIPRNDDIAIVELTTDVTRTQPTQILRSTPYIGEQLLLVGFGETGRTGDPQTTENSSRLAAFASIDGSVSSTTFSRSVNSYWVGGTGPGDSGGGQFVQRNNQWFVAGVTRSGTDPATAYGASNVATRVDAYAGWIESIVNPPFNAFANNGVLYINGSRQADVVELRGAGFVEVLYQGRSIGVFHGISRVEYRAGDGNDTLLVNAGFNTPLFTDHGPGRNLDFRNVTGKYLASNGLLYVQELNGNLWQTANGVRQLLDYNVRKFVVTNSGVVYTQSNKGNLWVFPRSLPGEYFKLDYNVKAFEVTRNGVYTLSNAGNLWHFPNSRPNEYSRIETNVRALFRDADVFVYAHLSNGTLRRLA